MEMTFVGSYIYINSDKCDVIYIIGKRLTYYNSEFELSWKKMFHLLKAVH